MHMMAFNEFGFVIDEFDATDYPILARLLFCTYMILVSILLVNMIIAMLGKTYQDIASQPNENLRQWARALLIVERMWTKSERLRMLDKYSHRPPAAGDSSGGRKFGLTWTLSVSIFLSFFFRATTILSESLFFPHSLIVAGTPLRFKFQEKDYEDIKLSNRLKADNTRYATRRQLQKVRRRDESNGL